MARQPPSPEVTLESLAAHGVVGAGGAGFPTHVKFQSPAEVFILNAAECEPLLHKDKEILHRFSGEILEGMEIAGRMVGARRLVIGVKHKYHALIDHLESVRPPGIEIVHLTDTYPAGDEQILIYDVTKRVVPPGGLPRDVGCLVNNVETILNLTLRRPVTRKYLTVTGAVAQPVTLCVPVGISLREVIDAAGGATTGPFEILLGGVMMGKLAESPDQPVTKTTGGVYVFPADHPLIRRYRMDFPTINRIGRSACDQCNFCTELCPRYLIGHPIEPAKAMRTLGFIYDEAPSLVGTLYCCECNLCTLIACPEDLDPKNVCVQGKARVRELGLKWKGDPNAVTPHSMYDGRRTPIQRLITKLGLRQFRNEGALRETVVETDCVRLPLKQHAGAPSVPAVQVGDKVKEGDPVAVPPPRQLGAVIHASIPGTVTGVTDTIEIRR